MIVGSYWQTNDDYDFVLNRDGGSRGTVKVHNNKLIHCGLYMRNYVQYHSGLGCAVYQLNSSTGSLQSNMQAPINTFGVPAKDFMSHSHLSTWSFNSAVEDVFYGNFFSLCEHGRMRTRTHTHT